MLSTWPETVLIYIPLCPDQHHISDVVHASHVISCFLSILDSAADLGLSMFAWEAVCPNGIAGKRCFLALFDMNRWYNAQMPEIIRCALLCVRFILHSACVIFLLIIIIIMQMPMFMVLSSWQSHCESSPGSFDECRIVPSSCWPRTKPDDLGFESVCRLPESIPTITIYYYYSAWNLILILPFFDSCPTSLEQFAIRS